MVGVMGREAVAAGHRVRMSVGLTSTERGERLATPTKGRILILIFIVENFLTDESMT